MSCLKLTFLAVSLPPFGGAMMLTMLVPEIFGLIEATSNGGRIAGVRGDCGRACGALTRPVKMDTERQVTISSILFGVCATSAILTQEASIRFAIFGRRLETRFQAVYV
jgi:hypothetical protein